MAARPTAVRAELESADFDWMWNDGLLSIRLSAVQLHAAIVVESELNQ